MIITDLRQCDRCVACTVCQIRAYAVQIIGTLFVGHVIFVVCRKESNQCTDLRQYVFFTSGEDVVKIKMK